MHEMPSAAYSLRGHCCVGRKWDTTPAPREALRVGKYTTGVYSTPDKSPIRRLAAVWKVPRRRNATVPIGHARRSGTRVLGYLIASLATPARGSVATALRQESPGFPGRLLGVSPLFPNAMPRSPRVCFVTCPVVCTRPDALRLRRCLPA
jgi:hypothetical protein